MSTWAIALFSALGAFVCEAFGFANQVLVEARKNRTFSLVAHPAQLVYAGVIVAVTPLVAVLFLGDTENLSALFVFYIGFTVPLVIRQLTRPSIESLAAAERSREQYEGERNRITDGVSTFLEPHIERDPRTDEETR